MDKLENLIEEAKELKKTKFNKEALEIWRDKTVLLLEQFFGENNERVKSFKHIHFYGLPIPLKPSTEEEKIENRNYGLDRAINLLTRYSKTLEGCEIPDKTPQVLKIDYVNKQRISDLKEINLKYQAYDFTKLIKLCEEINIAFSNGMYFSVLMLLRAILDHIPPIFGQNYFKSVASKYGDRSFKENMSNLEKFARKISDSYLHTPIRKKEILPNENQVNFSNSLDVLLGEIIRIVKEKI